MSVSEFSASIIDQVQLRPKRFVLLVKRPSSRLGFVSSSMWGIDYELCAPTAPLRVPSMYQAALPSCNLH